MRTLLFIFTILAFLLTYSSSTYSGDLAVQAPTMYETPIIVENKDGLLLFKDAKQRSFYFKGSNILKFQQSWDLKIFIPLIVAIVASLSSIILSAINYRQMKRGKWHEIWVTSVLNNLDDLYNDVNMLITSQRGSIYESAILQKTKVHLVSLLGFDAERNCLVSCFEELERGLTTKTNHDEIYSSLTRISEIVLKEIRK